MSMNARRRRAHDQQGAAMVEMALVLPLLLLILFGIIQFGLLLFRYQGMQTAAREGARVASIGTNDTSAILARVDDTLDQLPFGSTEPITTVSPSSTRPCQGRSGQSVTVTVTYDNVVDLPLFPSKTKSLTATAEFRCE
jgi:Flp pilus assembly protein TadG